MKRNRAATIVISLFIISFMGYFFFHHPVSFQGYFIYEGDVFVDTCTNTTILDGFNTNEVLYFQFNNQSAIGENDRIICDRSGKNNTGYVINGRWNASGGKFGDGAIDFKGGQRVVVADTNALSPNTTGQFSVAFWIKFTSNTFPGEEEGYLHYMGKGGYGNDYEYMFRQYNDSNPAERPNRISFYVFNKTGGWGVGSYAQDPMQLGQWMYIVGVINGTHTQFWKNGVLRDSDDYEGIIFPKNGNAPLSIGTANGDSYLYGSIDELRIYNKSLSALEIAELYTFVPANLNTSQDDPLEVALESPSNTTYAVDNYEIIVSLNKQGICKYSLDNGQNNRTLLSSNNLTFSAEESNVQVGNYVLTTYCQSGSENNVTSVYFSIISSPSVEIQSSSSGGGSSGGSHGSSSQASQGEPQVSVQPEGNSETEDALENNQIDPFQSISGYSISGDDQESTLMARSLVFSLLITIAGITLLVIYHFFVKPKNLQTNLQQL